MKNNFKKLLPAFALFGTLLAFGLFLSPDLITSATDHSEKVSQLNQDGTDTIRGAAKKIIPLLAGAFILVRIAKVMQKNDSESKKQLGLIIVLLLIGVVAVNFALDYRP